MAPSFHFWCFTGRPLSMNNATRHYHPPSRRKQREGGETPDMRVCGRACQGERERNTYQVQARVCDVLCIIIILIATVTRRDEEHEHERQGDSRVATRVRDLGDRLEERDEEVSVTSLSGAFAPA